MRSKVKGVFSGVLLVALCSLSVVAFAAGSSSETGIGGIATHITGSFSAIGKLMIGVAYLAGIGFAIAAIFKFKQHKDNPQQVSIGSAIALMIIAIALVFLPGFFKPAGETLFGSKDETAGGFKGEGAMQIPGASGGSS